ncbi:MAG: terpene cyclase/mutase family protein [Pirellulaceae bacterium]|nr:terpene cyclase/mutase family protein [Pirellulaceae bacterium]
MSWVDPIFERTWQAWAYLTTPRGLAIASGIGFALLAIFFLLASRTRWGQSKPLTKCIVLSVLAHVWLLMYAVGHRPLLPQGNPSGSQPAIMLVYEEPIEEMVPVSADESEVENPPAPESTAAHTPTASLPAADELTFADLLKTMELLDAPTKPSQPEIASTEEQPVPEMTELVDATRIEPDADVPAPTTPISSVDSTAAHGAAAPVADAQTVTNVLPQVEITSLSSQYRLRQAPNRLQIASAYGADADTEAAVDAALVWLAGAQSEDGSWNAARFGGGTETRVLGENRSGTGGRADTGVSGLALLAMLSAGHTHRDGPYRQVVERGLTYLMQAQMPSGDLSGPKQIGNDISVVNARMYCHSIAMLALAEAYAMTGEPALRGTLLKATEYSIKAQDSRGGGWRYQPGDPGDLSLFGWQAMALSSLQRSGIQIPQEVQYRMRRFLDSCAAGRGGLARYRPGEGAPSETMTAEALACRFLLNYPIATEARREAVDFITRTLPGSQPDNVYFWYYATLALFQLQDEHWWSWNAALKARLLETQQPAYASQPGSWNPDGMWGGYGGRVYSTAMSCLCLEVYYRYLPLYQHSSVAGGLRSSSR